MTSQASHNQQSSSIEYVDERIIIIGTVHVSDESARLVKETIERLKPSVVALELDQGRLTALTHPVAMQSNRLGAGLSMLLIAFLERFAGEITGSAPGAEMLKAVQAAHTVGSQIELIDIPIQQTMLKIRNLSRTEKLRIGIDSVISILLLPFAGFNLSRLTENMEYQINRFRQRYPGLGRILLDEREEYMAGRILQIAKSTPGLIIVVVGYGHMKSLTQRLGSNKQVLQSEHGFKTSIHWTISS
jgi:pheromone shutdown protein TraB